MVAFTVRGKVLVTYLVKFRVSPPEIVSNMVPQIYPLGEPLQVLCQNLQQRLFFPENVLRRIHLEVSTIYHSEQPLQLLIQKV